MTLDNLLEQIRADKQSELLTVEINNCLNNLLHGNYGKMQHFYSGKVYCCKSGEYCPLQLQADKRLKECQYTKLQKEMEKNRY
ncbi:MAG: hypothetical protein ABIA37_03730 [Candidatus Woesearchaeota archaeon]